MLIADLQKSSTNIQTRQRLCGRILGESRVTFLLRILKNDLFCRFVEITISSFSAISVNLLKMIQH